MRTLPRLVLVLCDSMVALGVSSRDSRAYREWVWGEGLFRPGAFPLKTNEAVPSYDWIPERLYRPPRRQNTDRPPDRSSSGVRQRSSLEKQQAALAKQAAALAKQAAALAKQQPELERPEATLQREHAKFKNRERPVLNHPM
jgi:hypothetical protein